MPLRDHFHPPLAKRRSWQAIHGGWPMMIAAELGRRLPSRYIAEPQVKLGSSIEIDVAAFDGDFEESTHSAGIEADGGLATAVWSPPKPTSTVETDVLAFDEYEVRVYDIGRGRRLVAAVEIVSPANKDRPRHRRAFVAKCAALLQRHICVVIIDIVTSSLPNLHDELMDLLGPSGPSLTDGPSSLYAITCRSSTGDESWLLETWAHTLTIGGPLPTLPLWLAEGLAVPLDLEATYEEACKLLLIP